jgi:hypothetical protein
VVNVNGEYVVVENVLIHSINWIRDNFFIPYSKEKHRIEKFFSSSQKNPYLPSLKEKIKKAMENPFQSSLASSSKEKESNVSSAVANQEEGMSFEVEGLDNSDDNVKNKKNIDVENNNYINSSSSYPSYFERTNCLLKENNIATPIVFFRNEFTVPLFLSFFILFVFACMVIIMVLYVLLIELFVDRIGVVERRGSSFNSLFNFDGKTATTSQIMLSSSSSSSSSPSFISDVFSNSTHFLSQETPPSDDPSVVETKSTGSPFDLILQFFNGQHYVAFAVLITFTLVAWPLTM